MATQPPPPPSPSVKERKVSQSASCKIDCIIKQLFLPMLGMPTPDRTCFQPDDDTLVIRQVAEECPAALVSEVEFVQYMVVLYRKFQAQNACEDFKSNVDSNDHCSNHHVNHTIHANKNKACKSNNQILNTLLPLTGQVMPALQLPVQVVQDGADLPKALAHTVDATAGVGEL
jgi:hypothetical protein